MAALNSFLVGPWSCGASEGRCMASNYFFYFNRLSHISHLLNIQFWHRNMGDEILVFAVKKTGAADMEERIE